MRVAVVGLGPAGIRAAMRLREEGCAVDLFDARERIGGRLWTFERDGIPWFEAGGEWIDGDHQRVYELAERLRCLIDGRGRPPGRLQFRGSFGDEATPWPDAQAAQAMFEQRADADIHWVERGPNAEGYADADHRTLAEVIAEVSPTERSRWWLEAVARSDEGEDPERIGWLGWLHGYAMTRWRGDSAMSAGRFKPGMSEFLRRALATVDAAPNLNHRLVGWDPEQVSLRFETPTGVLEHRADAVVLAGRFPDFEVGARVRVNYRVGRSIKVALRFSRSWWHERGENGSLLTDGPLQQTWEGSLSEVPILNVYVNGEGTARYREGGVPQALEDLAMIYPEARDCFVEGWLVDWIGDPRAQGGFSHYPPGFFTHTPLVTPRWPGRVAVCGEHAANWSGFVEGALESAERAVHELLYGGTAD